GSARRLCGVRLVVRFVRVVLRCASAVCCSLRVVSLVTGGASCSAASLRSRTSGPLACLLLGRYVSRYAHLTRQGLMFALVSSSMALRASTVTIAAHLFEQNAMQNTACPTCLGVLFEARLRRVSPEGCKR